MTSPDLASPGAADQEDVVKLDTGPLSRLEGWMGRAGLGLVPARMSANQVTVLGGVAGVLAGVCFGLAPYGRAWFAAGALMVLLHWVCDNVDGHVARQRDQCSAAGRFLDIFSDALTFTAIGLGFACSGYAHFEIVATATLFCLLQYVLTVLWIAFARVWPFPAFGPAEAQATTIVMALLMLVLPAELVHLGGRGYSLVDLVFALTIPGSVVTLVTSGLQLFRHLQRSERAA
jgi:phosphatidylglycerophosphate synthase